MGFSTMPPKNEDASRRSGPRLVWPSVRQEKLWLASRRRRVYPCFMDERSERGHAESEAFEHSAGSMSARESCLQAQDDTDDPVLRALKAAPRIQLSPEEEAELYERERNAGGWIPAGQFMAFVESLRDEHQDVDD